MLRVACVCLGSVLVLVAGCSEPASVAYSCSGVTLGGSALLLASNYQASALGRVDEKGCLTEIPDIALGTDPAFSLGNAGPFVNARSEELVYSIDPDKLAITRTFVPSTDAEKADTITLPCGGQVKGLNPHDADLDASGRLWVARYNRPSLGVVAPDGSFEAAVDLSPLADADGLPEIESVRVVGDRAYATLELLDRCSSYKPTGHGRIAVIDVTTKQLLVAETIELGGTNPFGRMVGAPWDSSGHTVGIALPGDTSAIELGDAAAIVDLSKPGEGKGFGDEATLGGSVVELVLAAPDEAYLIVADTTPTINAEHVVRIDPQTGAIGPTLLDSRWVKEGGGYCYAGLALVGTHLLIGENDRCTPSIHVFDRATGAEEGVLHPSRLPPVSLLPLP